MGGADSSAGEVVARLEALRSEKELATVRKRLASDEAAFGVRMRELFDVAKAHTDLPLDDVDRLLDHFAYESRMAAMCILDFRARRRLDDDQRRELYELYLDRHEAITTWDLVDRAAPRTAMCKTLSIAASIAVESGDHALGPSRWVAHRAVLVRDGPEPW